MMKLIKIIPVVLMGILLSGNVRAASINDEEFLNSEMTVQMECWMFDTNYLSNVTLSIEDWMMDTSWLVQVNEGSAVETWMLESEYLVDETQAVELWMSDSNYLGS